LTLARQANCVDRINEQNKRLLREAIQAFHASNKTTSSTGNLVNSAVEKFNTAAALLFRIVFFLREEWHPDASLPTLDRENLETSIEVASAEIQKLIDVNDKAKADDMAKTGSIHKLGKVAENICVNLKPFIKTFLSVAIKGSAVRPVHELDGVYLYVDSYPQSIRAIM